MLVKLFGEGGDFGSVSELVTHAGYKLTDVGRCCKILVDCWCYVWLLSSWPGVSDDVFEVEFFGFAVLVEVDDGDG